jgi:hypothetical protein
MFTGIVGGAGRDLKAALRLAPLTATSVGDDLLIEADVLRDLGSGEQCSPGS